MPSMHPGSFYGEQVVPRLTNLSCGLAALRPYRARVCAGLAGDVLEIGFGSGHNVPFYPSTVRRVVAVEPSDIGWKLAAARLSSSQTPVVRSALDGQALDVPDETFDAALSTWALCTIPDVAAALREVRRVLKPGAEFHFLEHGLAPDRSVQRWQKRFEPIQSRLAGGCHLTRPVAQLITDAGLVIRELEEFYERGPKTFGAFSLGTAVPE